MNRFRRSTDLEGALGRFVPEGALEKVCEMLRQYPHHLEITPARSSKYGDFSIDYPSGEPRISVNGNLNPYSFLITLTHELAHLLTWLEHRDAVKPHGPEWKKAFRFTLGPFLNQSVFPDDVERALHRYLHNPAASTCSDTHLAAVLSRYDRNSHPDVKLLQEVPANARFMYGRDKRVFIKGEQLRKRYQCRCESTKAVYLFSPIAKIRVIAP
jgi:SprT protein